MCDEEYEEKDSRRGKELSLYRKKQTHYLAMAPILPLALARCFGYGHSESERSIKAALFRSQRQPHGWLRCSRGNAV